jgi:hypothetical protein
MMKDKKYEVPLWRQKVDTAKGNKKPIQDHIAKQYRFTTQI